MNPEPYVVRKVTRAQLLPLAVGVVWCVLQWVLSLGFPAVFFVVLAIYLAVEIALQLERLRIDHKGVKLRPASRIPWDRIENVTYEGPHELGVKLKPGTLLPRGARNMIDGEVVLPARGFELDPARLDEAVRTYSEAGGSFSGMPGSGASSSGMSAGGPSG